ncbi:hypothetical protein LIER_16505 [Lithospermum erythrorhizon]|uniref:Uncharacterized protein n=1 Tax=Lithospermum erythrorhizon TaxID=34254 RepID=A0AAV3Q8S1_LITER
MRGPFLEMSSLSFPLQPEALKPLRWEAKHSMDDNQRLDLDRFFLRQLTPSMWDTRPYVYKCPYLEKRSPAHWDRSSPIKGGETLPQPLEMISPTSSSSIPPSSSTIPLSTENYQAGDDVESQGEDSTTIRKLLPVKLTNKDLSNFREYFDIPDSVEIYLPLEGDPIFEPLVDPSRAS